MCTTHPLHQIQPDALKAQFNIALTVQAGSQKRIPSQLNKAVSEVVFQTAAKAVQDTRWGVEAKKFKVVSAPTGSSKTTSAIAFAFAGTHSIPGFSCAFVVEEIRAAQEIYSQLLELLPASAVGIWTSQHNAKRPPEGHTGGPLFTIEQMRELPIVVFTHSKWIGEMERGGDDGVRLYRGKPRDVMFIDEQPKVIDIIDRSPHQIGMAKDYIEKMEPNHPWVSTLSTVFERMNTLFNTDGSEMEAVELLHCLEAADFSEAKAEGIWRKHYGTAPNLEYMETFRFLHACTLGYVFFNRRKPRGFIAYIPQFAPEPNQVLLDATADLSGLTLLLGGELAPGLPQVDYRNLTINHLGQPAKFKSVNEVLKVRSRAVDYAEWIREAVMNHSAEGDTILVVMHKAMITMHELFPHVPQEADSMVFQGRKAYLINWGQGIGSNTYKDATRVFLFSEFYQPRKVTVATTLGATSTPAGNAPLDKLSRNLSGEFLDVYEGDIIRWIKQLASRGNVRNINEDGTCGQMDLYLSMDFNRLVRNLDRLFPGASAPIRVKRKPKLGDIQESTTGRHGLITLLSTTDRAEVSSKEVEGITGIKSRDLSRELLAPTVQPVMSAYGWSLTTSKALGYPGKGSWLIRPQSPCCRTSTEKESTNA